MATLTIADLDNGKRDLQTVDAVANSSEDTAITRYGDSVLTLAGALRRLGYKAPVAYASGLNVDSALFTVSRDGVIYAPDPLLVPFTTGAWDAAQWRPVQNTAITNQIYQFPTLGDAESAAATLPNGTAVVVDGASQGHTNLGAYVPESGVPAISFQDYAAMDAYSGKATFFQVKKPGIDGLWEVIPGDTTSAGNVGTLRVLADGRRVRRVSPVGMLRASWFELDGSGGSDNSAKFATLKNAAQTLSDAGIGPLVIFDSGDYTASAFPNWWDVQGLTIECQGRVFWTNTGTGTILRLETSQLPLHRWGLKIGCGDGKLVLRGGPTTGSAANIQNIYASDIRFIVNGCGSDKTAVTVDSCVLSEFDIKVTPHDDDENQWYLGARPKNGMKIGSLNSSYLAGTSYCNFRNFKSGGMIEGYGLYAEHCLGNNFFSGGIEFCNKGAVIAASSNYTRFWGFNFEEDPTVDIEDAGQGTEFHGVDSQKMFLVGKSTIVFAGNHDAIYDSGLSTNATLTGVKFAKGLSSGGLAMTGPGFIARDCIDLRTGRYYGVTRETITPSGSPFTFTNSKSSPVRVVSVGGTVSQTVFYSGSESMTVAVGSMITLMPGEAVSFQYSIAPEIKVISMGG